MQRRHLIGWALILLCLGVPIVWALTASFSDSIWQVPTMKADNYFLGSTDITARLSGLAYPEETANYIIYKDGSTYYAKNGHTGAVISSGNAATLINSVISLSPLNIYLATGIYSLSAKISIPTNAKLRIHGAGIEATVLTTTSATINAIQIGDGVTTPSENTAITISDLTINSNILPKTAGSGILINRTLYVILERLKIFNQFIGLQIAGASHQIRVSDVSVINSTDTMGTGILLDAVGGSDHYFRTVYITGHDNRPAYGLKILNTGGAWFSDMDILFNNEGIEVTPGNGDSVSWLWFNGVSADNSIINNWYFYASGSGICQGVSLVNCWGSTGRYGLVISNAWGVVINSGRFLTNDRAGIALYGGEDIKISHSLISGNGFESANTYSGIYIDANLGHFEIKDNKIGFSLFVPGTHNTQKYGIEVSAGTADYYTITGNDLTNNNTAGLIDGGTGVHKVVSDNIP